MSQENSDCCDVDDQSSDCSSIIMNLDEEHLPENSEIDLANVFDSLLFDFEENNPLGSLRVNLKKKEIKINDISFQRRQLRRRSNLSDRYQQQPSCVKRFDLVSLRLREDQMHLALFLEETALNEALKVNSFSDMSHSLRKELTQIIEPIMCHFTMTMGKSSMVHWFNDTILPLFLNDSPSALYILCEECWITVHDTLKRKIKSMDGFREYKMKKKLQIIKMKEENSLIELPAVTFTKHPFSDLTASPKIAPAKKPVQENGVQKPNSLTYINANSTLNKSSGSSPSTTSPRQSFSPISSYASLNSSSSSSSSSPNSAFVYPISSLSPSPVSGSTNHQLVKPKSRSPTDLRRNKRRDLCGTKKQVKIVKNSTPSPLQPQSLTKRKRENLDSSDPVYSSGLNSIHSSSGSTSDEYLDLLNVKKNQLGKADNSEPLSKYEYKPGKFRF